MQTFLSKSDEILILAPICLKLMFRFKIFKDHNVRFLFSTFKLASVQSFN